MVGVMSAIRLDGRSAVSNSFSWTECREPRLPVPRRLYMPQMLNLYMLVESLFACVYLKCCSTSLSRPCEYTHLCLTVPRRLPNMFVNAEIYCKNALLLLLLV